MYGLAVYGVPSGPARIKCDGDGCDVVMLIGKARGGGNILPPQWFFAGKSPPGWRRAGGEHADRRDYCPKCKASVPGTPGETNK